MSATFYTFAVWAKLFEPSESNSPLEMFYDSDERPEPSKILENRHVCPSLSKRRSSDENRQSCLNKSDFFQL